ncbi:hypothetical protein [Legionella septentrionalis]|uniref:hypothetical protein n=1 Tax=Legionella septentrionalis TaxID=2498109 RepID=UPI0011D12865|nr:hypothetical protein [Legionella septentrionalis]
MDNECHLNKMFSSSLFLSSLLLLIVSFSPTVKAAPSTGYTTGLTASPMVLSYYYGPNHPRRYYNRNYPRYHYGPGYGGYWTNWYRIGPRCQKSCFVNRWGNVVRCSRRCY